MREREKNVTQPCWVVAHRGASLDAPENTLPAIEKAIAAGADMIALDVRTSKDDEPIVLADPLVDRTTNGRGRADRMTLEELRALDAGSWFRSEFAGAKIPTLTEALKAFSPDTRLLLAVPELKEGAFADKLIAALSVRSQPEEDLLLLSDSPSLNLLRIRLPKFCFALALDAKVPGRMLVEKAVKLNLQAVRPFRSQADAALMTEAQKRGLKVFVHFADEEAEWRPLLNRHANGILTHRPDRLRAALGEK
jgi:glycerophosphoryl diester phosphodiesterase